MKFPKVYPGDIVCITTCHNETQDDLHFGLVSKVNVDAYPENGKIEVIYMLNHWIESKAEFDYKPNFTGWHTWRLTKECVAINEQKQMFTHSAPPEEWRD